MQKHHYEFNKNSVGHRVYYPKDVEVIKEIVTLKNSGSLTLSQAVKAILESDMDDITDAAPLSILNDFKKECSDESKWGSPVSFNRISFLCKSSSKKTTLHLVIMS